MKRHLARFGAIGILATAATFGATSTAQAADCTVWRTGTATWNARCSSTPYPYDVFRLRLRCRLDLTNTYWSAVGNIVTPSGTSTATCPSDYYVVGYSISFYDWW